MRLDCAITSCPRHVADYLGQTLRSIEAAGFPSPTVVWDGFRIGAYRAFKRALDIRLTEAPDCDWYGVFQDDVEVSRGCFEWLARQSVLDRPQLGVLSLYTNAANHSERSGWSACDLSEPHGIYHVGGACAVFLRREHALKFLRADISRESKNRTECWLASYCRENGLEYLVHSPSPVEHIGSVSSMDVATKVGLIPNRRAARFAQDLTDCDDSPFVERVPH